MPRHGAEGGVTPQFFGLSWMDFTAGAFQFVSAWLPKTQKVSIFISGVLAFPRWEPGYGHLPSAFGNTTLPTSQVLNHQQGPATSG